MVTSDEIGYFRRYFRNNILVGVSKLFRLHNLSKRLTYTINYRNDFINRYQSMVKPVRVRIWSLSLCGRSEDFSCPHSHAFILADDLLFILFFGLLILYLFPLLYLLSLLSLLSHLYSIYPYPITLLPYSLILPIPPIFSPQL